MCIIAVFSIMLAAVAAWGVDIPGRANERDNDKTQTELRSGQQQTEKQNARESRPDPWEGKERVRGWSTAVVTPPAHTYNQYNYYGYPPAGYPHRPHRPYYPYYQRQPWGYDGPAIVDLGGKYDTALVWNDQRKGFAWEPIIPSRPSANIPGPVINPNFKVKNSQTPQQPVEQDWTDEQYSQSSDQSTETRPFGSWRKRALVSSVNRQAQEITVVTPKGVFVVNTSDAVIFEGDYLASIANISEGDSVRIWGELSGVNQVIADHVEVIGEEGRTASESALQPTRLKGKVVYIDYPAFTFRIAAESGELRVLVGEDTVITSPDGEREAFMDLELGQMVKVVGIGNISTGYAASEVVITDDNGT
jgi:hypothetical protein